MRRGYTSKPCPVCKTVNADYGRPIDGICPECNRLVEDGRRYRRQMAKAARVLVRCLTAEFPGGLPYLRHVGSFHDDPAERFRTAYHAVLRECAVLPSSKQDNRYLATPPKCLPVLPDRDTSGMRSTCEVLFVAPGAADALQQLYVAVQEMLDEAHAEGRQEGDNFVSQLVSGDVSMKDLTDVSAEKQKGKRRRLR